MLSGGFNVLENEINDVIVHAKRPKTLKAKIKKFKPRLVVTPITEELLFV